MSKLFPLIIFLCLVAVISSGCQKSSTTKPVNSNKSENLNQQVQANVNTIIEEPYITPEEDEQEILWQQVEGGQYLPVPYYYQKDAPMYGSYACGPASLKMVLEYKKQIGTVDE